MAQIDTSIYSQIRPYIMADPMQTAAKMYTLQNAAMGAERNRRAMEEEDAMKTVAREAGGDMDKMVQGLLSKGMTSRAAAIRKQQAEEVKSRLQIAEVAGSAAISLDAGWRDALQKAGGNREAAMAAFQPIYSQTKQRLSQVGLGNLPDQFDPEANFASIGTAKEVATYLNGLRQKYGAPVAAMQDGKEVLIQPDQTGGAPRVMDGFQPKPQKSELDKLVSDRDALPAGDPRRALYDRRIEKLTTHAPAAKQTTIVNPDRDPFKNEKVLRDEYKGNPLVKAADEMGTAFRMIEAAYQRPSPANDLAMATKFMKILDPTSVVRESEFALAVNATGILDKVFNYADQISKGLKLNPAQRKDFYDSAKAINDAFQAEARKVGDYYQGIAKQYNLKPENVIVTPGKSDAATDGWSIKPVP